MAHWQSRRAWNFGTKIPRRSRADHNLPAYLAMMGGLAPVGTCKWREPPEFPSPWRAGSNDQCEQFNDPYSDHQHSECYRVVIEPMRPLFGFELLDESSDVRRDWRRESVILGPEAVPN